MGANFYLSISECLAALDTDTTRQDQTNEIHLKLVVDRNAHPPEKASVSCFDQPLEGEEKLSEHSGEDGGELYADLPGMSRSALAIYFKSINRYPLLDEDTEKNLAKGIKRGEKELKRLISTWLDLMRKELVELSSQRQIPEVREGLSQIVATFPLFDQLIILEGERKKISRRLKNHSSGISGEDALQDELNKLNAEISKCIAKIHIDDPMINTSLGKMKKIPCRMKYKNKRKEIESGMVAILRKIGNSAKDIKTSKNQLVEANLRLVISIAKKYCHHGVALPDLIQEGNLGLMRAIDTYDYHRGNRLVTYASWWIRQAMIRAIDCQSKTVRTPVYVNEKLNRIIKAAKKLFQEYDREPTREELAEETSIPLESIDKIVQSFKEYIPLDVLTEEQGEQRVIASSWNENTSIADRAISSHLSQIVDQLVLTDLTEREREIVKMRFGIGAQYDHTLEEIGKEFSLSRERIRQILEMALCKLKTPKQTALLKDFINPN